MPSGYQLHTLWTRLQNRGLTRLIRGGFASFGSGSTIAHPVRLGGIERVRIGANVFIGPASWLQVVDEGNELPDTVIEIGDDVRMSGMCVISGTQSVRIEQGALLARNVYIADHGHAFHDPDEAIHRQGLASIEPVRIGPRSWLGQNVVVLPGTDIGAGSIIGANSVVRGVIPPRSVAVGAPAKVVRSLDDDPEGGHD